jgi:hypothetical protein
MRYISWLTKALIMFAFLSFSCSNSRNNEDFNNDFFDYLSSSLKISLPCEDHTWILIPSIGCIGCKHSTLLYLKSISETQDLKHISIIYSGINTLHPEDYNEHMHVICDTEKVMESLRINIASSTIIHTSTKKIKAVYYANPGNLDSLSFFISPVY